MTRSDGIVAFISSLPGSSGLTTENAVQAISVASEAASCISRDPKQEKIARVQLIISERARFHTIFEGDPTATPTVHVRSRTRPVDHHRVAVPAA